MVATLPTAGCFFEAESRDWSHSGKISVCALFSLCVSRLALDFSDGMQVCSVELSNPHPVVWFGAVRTVLEVAQIVELHGDVFRCEHDRLGSHWSFRPREVGSSVGHTSERSRFRRCEAPNAFQAASFEPVCCDVFATV